MKSHRLAVIDLGSNTFHLLIVHIYTDGTWLTILKDRRYVKLASGGLQQIDAVSMNRAALVMQEFADQIATLEVEQIIAIGTSALREAHNQHEVLQLMEKTSGIPVRVINGHQEAIYIWKGINSSLPPLDRHGLIMDIGGGSVEFILFLGQQIVFSSSYNIGVAVLYRQFHLTDPITDTDISLLEAHIGREIAPLFSALEKIPDYYLIGASGSFEVIRDVLPKLKTGAHWSELEFSNLPVYLDQVIGLDLESRRARPEIPEERVDYIVVAYLLIRFLIRKIPPNGLYYSDFALKEGIIAEHIERFLD